MGKFVGYYDDGDKKVKVGESTNRNEVVIMCANHASGDYCLDKKEDRIEGLRNRDFYIIGCGPRSFSIEEE